MIVETYSMDEQKVVKLNYCADHKWVYRQEGYCSRCVDELKRLGEKTTVITKGSFPGPIKNHKAWNKLWCDADPVKEILHGMTILLKEWEDAWVEGFPAGVNSTRMTLFGGFAQLAREAKQVLEDMAEEAEADHIIDTYPGY